MGFYFLSERKKKHNCANVNMSWEGVSVFRSRLSLISNIFRTTIHFHGKNKAIVKDLHEKDVCVCVCCSIYFGFPLLLLLLLLITIACNLPLYCLYWQPAASTFRIALHYPVPSTMQRESGDCCESYELGVDSHCCTTKATSALKQAIVG